jgi:hypothetical protein
MPNLRDIALKIGYGPQDNRLRDLVEAKTLPETPSHDRCLDQDPRRPQCKIANPK